MTDSPNFFDLSGEVILLTGCSGQLGNYFTEALISQNAKVIGLDIQKPDFLKKAFNNPNFKFKECDITNEDQMTDALNFSENTFGVPTILINNAALDSPPSDSSGGNFSSPFEEYPYDIWKQVINVNLNGVFVSSKVIGSKMASNKNGNIINISSIYGLISPDQSLYEYKRLKGDNFFKPGAYSASKSGVINFSRYLSVYWANKNIRVNNLVLSGIFNNQDDKFLENYNKRIPIGRMATKEDIIGPLIFLCSDASAYMTGSDLLVDGGWTAI